MKLTIVLVNWRNATETIRCAGILKRWHTLKPALVIVDNESTDRSRRALAEACAADQLICSPVNCGYGGGNNLGLRATSLSLDTAVLLLNSDVEISEACVEGLLFRLRTDPELSIIGPTIREIANGASRCYIGGRDISVFPATRIEANPVEFHAQPGYPLAEVDYVPGMAFMARASVFAGSHFLDEEYFFSGEIADFCKTARATGHKLCIDLEAEAIHRCDETSRLRDTLYVYYSLRNRFLYVTKHRANEKVWYFTYWMLIGCRGAAAAIMRSRWGRARAILLAIWDGLRGHYGNQHAKFL